MPPLLGVVVDSPPPPKKKTTITSSTATAKKKPLSFRVKFPWTLLGNVIYAGCQWSMLVVLAKLGSSEMVGQFALGLAMNAPVFMFANLQPRTHPKATSASVTPVGPPTARSQRPTSIPLLRRIEQTLKMEQKRVSTFTPKGTRPER